MANKNRLIDADKIYDAVERRYQISSGTEHRCERDFLDLICASDTVDAVEVVRCKDCKFGVIPYGDEHDGWIECSNIHGRPLFSRDGFCSLGERRTDG